jgi:hypothetical protein
MDSQSKSAPPCGTLTVNHISTREVPGRGVAAFAARSFAPGDTILQEPALLVSSLAAQGKGNFELWEALKREERARRLPPFIPHAHIGALAALRDLGPNRCRSSLLTKCGGSDDLPDQQEQKRQLAVLRSMIREGLLPQASTTFTAGEYAKLRQVITLNGFRFNEGLHEDHPHYDTGEALFDQVSRINHACDPNAYFDLSWDCTHGTVINCVRSLKDITEGEEINISYVPQIFQIPLADRRQQLSKHWGFDCDCKRCCAEGYWSSMAMPMSNCTSCNDGGGAESKSSDVDRNPNAVVQACTPRSDGSSVGFCWDDLHDPDLDV